MINECNPEFIKKARLLEEELSSLEKEEKRIQLRIKKGEEDILDRVERSPKIKEEIEKKRIELRSIQNKMARGEKNYEII